MSILSVSRPDTGYSCLHMARFSLRIVALGFLATCSIAVARPRAEERDVRKSLEALVASGSFAGARLSLLVKDLDDGSIVFSHDADELLNPASNVKLVTAAAALVQLGTEYRFETEFYIEQGKGGSGRNTLYVRGRGDPTITNERLFGMVSELIHAGIPKTVGDIVLDDTYFEDDGPIPGYDQETGDKAYLAPAGALSLNWNTVSVYLRPGDAPGRPAVATLEPSSPYFSLTSNLTTGRPNQRRLIVSSNWDERNKRQQVLVRGTLPPLESSFSVYRRISNPTLYFGNTFREFLKLRGVRVTGRVRTGVVPNTLRPLYVSSSETLDVILKKMNKHSSNFLAEQLLKVLGAEGPDGRGSRERGIAHVENFLEREVGLPRGTYVMRNGSGLNDANRFTASALVKLLVAMWKRFPLMPEYLSALGIAGKDGTLRLRYDGTEAAGRLRAKTGTLEHVSALSGYVQSVAGARYVFSFIVNDYPGRASEAANAIDGLGLALASTVTKQPEPTMEAQANSDTLAAQVLMYGGLARRADKRNVTFLHAAWRSEPSPQTKALIADALYYSDPRESGSASIVLESATMPVFLILANSAHNQHIPPPLLGVLTELASGGNGDAVNRILEFAKGVEGDKELTARLGSSLASIAEVAPVDFLQALRKAREDVRATSIDALVVGLMGAPQAQKPLLKDGIAPLKRGDDPAAAAFATTVEEQILKGLKNAQEAEKGVAAAPSGSPGGSAPAQ